MDAVWLENVAMQREQAAAQAATAELYATLPKAGAMLTSNRSRWVRNRNGIVKNERSTKTKKWKVVLAGSVLFFSGRSVVRGPSIRK